MFNQAICVSNLADLFVEYTWLIQQKAEDSHIAGFSFPFFFICGTRI
jgi:hypothetical protein